MNLYMQVVDRLKYDKKLTGSGFIPAAGVRNRTYAVRNRTPDARQNSGIAFVNKGL